MAQNLVVLFHYRFLDKFFQQFESPYDSCLADTLTQNIRFINIHRQGLIILQHLFELANSCRFSKFCGQKSSKQSQLLGSFNFQATASHLKLSQSCNSVRYFNRATSVFSSKDSFESLVSIEIVVRKQ